MKTLSTEMRNALNADNVVLYTAVYIDVSPTEQIRVHSGVGSYTIDGEVFTGVGELGSIDSVQKDGSTSPSGISMTLSGLDPLLITSVLSDGYMGRKVDVLLCILVNEYVDVHSHVLFSGRLDTMKILMGDTATIKVTAEDRLVDWQRGDVTRWNNASHQRILPAGVTDKFFEFVEQTVDKEIEFSPWIPQ